MKKFFILLSLVLLPMMYVNGQTVQPCKNAKGKWGYLNEDGSLAINFIYDQAYSFSAGIAKVKKGNKWGYIDPSGKEVIKIQYTDMGTWDNGRCKIAVGGAEKNGVLVGAKYGFIDIKGNTLLKPVYDKIGAFNNGLAYCVKSGKYGYINEDLTIVIPCNYTAVGSFNPQGYCWVAEGGKLAGSEVLNAKFGIVRKDGYVAVKPQYKHIGTFTEVIQEANPIYSYAIYSSIRNSASKKKSNDTKILENPEISKIMAETPIWNLQGYTFVKEDLFSDLNMNYSNYFAVSNAATVAPSDTKNLLVKGNDKIGIVDKNGYVVVKPGVYNVAFLPSDGIIPVLKTDKTGFQVNYISETGKLLLKKWTPSVCISPFENGVAVICNDSHQYLINNSGKQISAVYEFILPQNNGCHLVKGANGYGIISSSGEELVQPEWNLILPDNNKLYCARKDADGLYGYIDNNGQYIIYPVYSEARSFDNKYGCVKNHNGWGVIDTAGQSIIPCMWEDVMNVSKHHDVGCWVKQDGKWSFIHKITHRPIFNNTYVGVQNFAENGLAITYSSENLFGCIDKQGNTVLPMRLSTIGLVMDCLEEMSQSDIFSLSEIEAYRYNIKHNPNRNDFRLSHTLDNSMWEY